MKLMFTSASRPSSASMPLFLAFILSLFYVSTASAQCDDWYLPIPGLASGPAVQACEAPVGYFLADQACAQEVVDADPFCSGTQFDGLCLDAYELCAGPVIPGCTNSFACNYNIDATIDDGSCTFTQWYIPAPPGGGGQEAVEACPGDEPAGYVLADQACAQEVVDNDSFCGTSSFDGICYDAYNICVFGCTDPAWYIPSGGTTGPAVQACSAPEGYVFANQTCAQQTVDNDPFCSNNTFDGICNSAYTTCVGVVDCPELDLNVGDNCDDLDPTTENDQVDGDCVCAGTPIFGCTNAGACNYNPNAAIDDGTCTFAQWYIPSPPGGDEAVFVCPVDIPPGYILADQDCAQEVVDADSFCGSTAFDGICYDAYNLCVFGCEDPQWYLPIPGEGSGPAVFTCSAPPGYFLADQACAQEVVDGDSFCSNNTFDGLCQNAYEDCFGPVVLGCTDNGACNFNIDATVDDGSCDFGLWYIPIEIGLEPAVQSCSGPPDGYVLADQDCAQQTVDNDSWCSGVEWDNVCFTSYNECLGIECPEIGLNIGDACDDGDPTTENDQITADCICVGTPIPGCTNPDACNFDANAGVDDGSCTFAQWYIPPSQSNSLPAVLSCTQPDGYVLADDQDCVQQVVDEDSFCESTGFDGLCFGAYNECAGIFDCPALGLNIGDPCDDGNPDTSNDTVNADCECVGEYDCPALSLNIGDPCDDGNPDTSNDTVNADCECVGEYDCPALSLNIGDPCDDGNPDTSNDTVNADCECVGEYDCPALSLNIGDPCDDGDPTTENDVVNADCECIGTPIPVPGCTNPIACNFNPDANEDDGSCDFGPWYIPIELGDGPAVQSCFGPPAGYVLADQDCAQQVVDADPFCANTSWDEFCFEAYNECLGLDCPALGLNIGDDCDDGDPLTQNDEVNGDCECVGEVIEGALIVSFTVQCTESYTIELYEPGTANLVTTVSGLVNGDGTLTATGLPSGTYDVLVQLSSHLKKGFADVVISSGSTSLAGGVFIPGDLNGDNSINIQDFSIISANYGRSLGDPNYNALADLNCDDNVLIQDFSIFSANFGIDGQEAPLP